jgi:hypothetical protein
MARYLTVVTITGGRISEIAVNEVEGVPVTWVAEGCSELAQNTLTGRGGH